MTPEDRQTLTGIQADVQELRLCLQILMEEHQLMQSLLLTFVTAPEDLRALRPEELDQMLRAQRPTIQLAIAAALAKRRKSPPGSAPPGARN